jgi:predicted ATPase/class 3 adenylate cyclase
VPETTTQTHPTARLLALVFTDVAGSTRLWERFPDQMRQAVAGHDALSRQAVQRHGGRVVKMVGDGLYAVFEDPLDGLKALLELQLSLLDTQRTAGLELRIRSGLHVGSVEERDNDFFGPPVNRAARLMSIGHGQQILVSLAAALLVRDRLPEGTSLQDLGTVRLRDIDQPEQVHQLRHADLPTVFPPLKGLEGSPGNLPRPLTRLIGRTRDLDALSDRLARGRLLTLVGPGGIGKIRLAVAWALEHGPAYADGTWFLDLTTLSDAGLMMQSLASVLGVREETGHPLADTIAQHLSGRELLLVVDNCEHLIAGAADLVKRLLQAAEGLTVLATSREPLRLHGETVLPLEPLPVDPETASPGNGAGGGTPDDGPLEPPPSAFAALLTPQEADPAATDGPPLSEAAEGPELEAWLARRPAVALFAERVLSVRPQQRLSAAERRDMVTICRQLDGMPMALELAAARARSFTLAQIRQRLRDRFGLLNAGHRTAPPRQQTLAALIDWSHDLLTEPERCLLRRLAVFPGSFSLEAAEAVIPDEGLAHDEVLPLLSELVDKSLVARESASGRFRLLESVRDYARRKLQAIGEESTLMDRHLDWVLAFLEERRGGMTGPEQARLAGEIDVEQPHLAAAHAWACRSGHCGVKALRLVHRLYRYLNYRGLTRLGYLQAAQAVELSDIKASGEERGFALFALGSYALSLGKATEAQEVLHIARREAKDAGLESDVARTLQPLAHAAMELGQLAQAADYLAESVTIEQRMGRAFEAMAALSLLGQLQRTKQQLDEAWSTFHEALDIASRLGDVQSAGILRVNLAMVAVDQGHAEQARQYLRDILGAGEESSINGFLGSLLDTAAACAACSDAPLLAKSLSNAAESAWRESGTTRDPADLAFAKRWLVAAPSSEDAGQGKDHMAHAKPAKPLDLVRELLRTSPAITCR